jgi:chitinase
MPIDTGKHEDALRLILKSADIRSNFVERSRTTSRPKLAQGLIRIMTVEPWLTSDEANFRHFMKVLNRNGGGILFEVMAAADVDKFLANTAALAMQQAQKELKAA